MSAGGHERPAPSCAHRPAPIERVRGVIATRWLGGEEVPVTVGAITLLPHQRDAAMRIGRLLRDGGGALLADEVGLGKTYTALAAAAAYDPLVVVAPAALLPMWRASLDAARRAARVLSFERLSAPRPVAMRELAACVIADEAHHARTPGTRRYARLAMLTRGARVLLLTATPIHNRADDLRALLALFVGDGAATLGERELLRYVIRRERADALPRPDRHASRTPSPPSVALPRVGRVHSLAIGVDDRLSDVLLAIPPPVPARDGSPAAALVTISLAHAWMSSHGALRWTLRRRLARADALAHALAAGRHPTRRELRSWIVSDDVQLAFPELLSDAVADARASVLLETVRAHADGLRAALRALARAPDADDARADCVRWVRERHAGARVLAFAQPQATIDALFRRLAPDGGVARLSSRGARVAGGALARAEALRRFAPRAHGASEPSAAERIDLLLATDLLSEGVSLHDASVVIHLDLPWTPARLEQRVGRVRRLGSPHAEVHVYALGAPSGADELLRLTERLARKSRAAALVAALASALPVVTECHDHAHREVIPPRGRARAATTLVAPPDDARQGDDPAPGCALTPLAAAEWCRERLRAWTSREAGLSPRAELAAPPLVAAVVSPTDGWLALVDDGAHEQLLASLGDAAPEDDWRTIASALPLAFDGPPGGRDALEPSPDPARVARALGAAAVWLDGRRGARVALVGPPSGGAVRRFIARLDLVLGRATPFRRAQLAAATAHARRLALATRGLGAERWLESLIADDPADDVLVDRLARVDRTDSPGARPAASGTGGAPEERPARVIALILLVAR